MTSDAERIEKLLVALRYISRPTMGWNPNIEPDPAKFAQTHATEALARGALATCIRMATEALKADSDG